VDWSKRAPQTPPGDLEPTPELDQHAGAEDGPAEPEVLVLELPDLPPAGTLRLQHSQAREVAPTFEDFDLDFDADPTEQLDVAPQLAAAAPARQPGPSRARLAGCEVRRRPGALVLLALAAVAAVVLAAGSLGSETIAPSSVSPADRAQGGGQLHGKRAVRPRRRASLRRRRRVPRVRQATRPRRPVPAARPPVRVAPRPVAPRQVRTPRPAPAAPSPAPAPAPAPAPRAVPKPAAPKAGPEFL